MDLGLGLEGWARTRRTENISERIVVTKVQRKGTRN